jgi:UDP-N-acetylmuramyl pentapeptide phosphotransferase/UDP-N-acetylglucosamine-1-phosphate transferase
MHPIAFAAFIFIVSALSCAALVMLLRPLLLRYALARPNARSSHLEPTPQGGGIAVIGATIAVVMLTTLLTGHLLEGPTSIVLASVAFLALVGAIDDLRPIPVLPRLVLQIGAAAAVLAILPSDLRIVSFAPFWIERTLMLVAVLWFVNLVNFMDGLDWITVAEMLPVTIALAAFGFAGALPADTLPIMLALAGALLGFAPFNRPVAKLFLGDVGSLPIGLLIAWCLILLAGNGHLAAALLLPLYYLADATLTLGRRLLNGEKVWVAHRTHFYQRATDNGFKVTDVVREVFVLNIVLVALAASSLTMASLWTDIVLFIVGGVAVSFVLNRFSRPKQAASSA